MPFWKTPTSVEDYDRILGGAWRGWAMDFSISWYTSQRWRTCRAPSRICSSSSGLGPRKQPSEHQKRVKNVFLFGEGCQVFLENGLHVDEANRRELDGNFLDGTSTNACFLNALKKGCFASHSRHSQDLFGGEAQNFSRRAFFDVHSDHPFMDLIEESALVPPMKTSSQIQPGSTCTHKGTVHETWGSFCQPLLHTQKNVCFLKSVWNCHLSYHLFLSIKNAPFCEDLPHDVTTLTPGIGHRLPWRIWSFFLAHTTRCCYSLSFQQPKLEAETREGLWISMDFRVIGWGRDANLPWNCRYFLDANRNILPYRMQLFRVKQLHEEELIQRLWRSYYSVLYVHILESFFQIHLVKHAGESRPSWIMYS